jgi:hypothetical protein
MGKFAEYKDIRRVCYSCGSTKTSCYRWYFNFDVYSGKRHLIGMFCHNCYTKYVTFPRQVIRGYYRKQIRFKGQQLLLKINPHKGVCKRCGRQGLTHLHHQSYDDNDILAHTEELCPSCHAKETWKSWISVPERIRKIIS